MKIILFGFLIVLMLGFRSPGVTPAAPVVVELFTSQGCSSCPAADQLLGEVVENSNGNVIGLSFHVSYWNHLGWKDPYSSAEYTSRQRQYAQVLELSSVYTPQMIVNGKYEFVGSDRASLRKYIEQAKQESSKFVIDVVPHLNGHRMEVSYSLDREPTGEQLFAACVEAFVQNNVPSGENSGRVLKHHNVVRAFKMMRAEKVGKFELVIPEGVDPNKTSIVVYLQNSQLQIVAATQVKPKAS